MASGPTAGFAEITIPAVHAGSSIMPGKINPSLSETLNMICFIVIGNNLSVTLASQAGQFAIKRNAWRNGQIGVGLFTGICH